MTDTRTLADAIADIMRDSESFATLQQIEGHHPYLLTKDDRRIGLEEFAERPYRTRRQVIFETTESLLRYFSDHKQPGSRIYVSKDAMEVVAVIDEPTAEAASREDHKAQMGIVTSREWDRWTASDNHRMDQRTFGEFIEDSEDQIVDPNQADLLQMVMDLNMTASVAFESAQNLQDGSIRIGYRDDQRSKSFDLPSQFTIGIPVLRDSETQYRIRVRLKHRLKGAELSLFYQIIDRDRYIDDAFDDLMNDLRDYEDREKKDGARNVVFRGQP